MVPPSGTGALVPELAEKLKVALRPPPARLNVATQFPGVGVYAGFVLEIKPVPFRAKKLAPLASSTNDVRASEKPPTDQILPAGGLSFGLMLIESGVVTTTPLPTSAKKSPLVEVVVTTPKVIEVEVFRLFGTSLV